MNYLALREFFNEQCALPQRLGKHDCVLFVLWACKIGFGRDHIAGMRYTDRRSAVRQLREEGGLEGAFTKHFGELKSIDDLDVGDIINLKEISSVGLLMPGYVVAKGHYQLCRFAIDSNMVGWSS